MRSVPEKPPLRPLGVTRRAVLGLAAVLSASPLFAPRAFASRSAWRRGPQAGEGRGRGHSRTLHAAVGLGDGRVVVVGGLCGGVPTASVQLYDPHADAWTDLAPLCLPRARHAAALLPDGRIAILGGVYGTPLDSIEVYDPRTEEWTEGGHLPAPMADHAATACADGVLVTGGQTGLPALLVSIPPFSGA